MAAFPLRVPLGAAQADEVYYRWEVAETDGTADGWEVHGRTLVVASPAALASVIETVGEAHDIAADNAEYGLEGARARTTSLASLLVRLRTIAKES